MPLLTTLPAIGKLSSQSASASKRRLSTLIALSVIASSFMLCILLPNAGLAGTTNELVVNLLEPGVPAPPGAPPPPGSGPNAPRVIPGDADGANRPPPSGTALQDPIYGTNFPHRASKPRSIVNVVLDVPEDQTTFNAPRPQPGGVHVVLSFRTDALSAEQAQQLHGILGSRMNNLSSYQNVNATQAEIEQMQNILYPNPSENAQMITNGPNAGWEAKSLKVNAKPADGYPKPGRDPTPHFVRNSGLDGGGALEAGKLTYKSQLTTVRGFCRYLVLLGVVFSTVFMIIAAYGMIQGDRHAGSRITAAAGGLILLLSSYTIWKIAVTNSSRFPNTTDQALNPRWRQKGGETDQRQFTVLYRGKKWDEITRGSRTAGTSDPPKADTPTTPGAVADRRSNMKVRPLGAQVLR